MIDPEFNGCCKCWAQAKGNRHIYQELLLSSSCTPEEIAGKSAKKCPACGRKTLHVKSGLCKNSRCTMFNGTFRENNVEKNENSDKKLSDQKV